MAVGAGGAVKQKHAGRSTAIVAAVLIVAAGVLIACLAMARRVDSAVIQGVKPSLILCVDDDLGLAFLDGVTAVGVEDGEIYPVAAEAYAEDGKVAETLTPGTYRLRYTCVGAEAPPVESILTILPADWEPPVISGVQDVAVEVGGTVSYRIGVTVRDNMDPSVQLRIDAGQVDLTQPGEYPVVYSAVDSCGNEVAVTATVTVVAPVEEEAPADNSETAENAGTGPVNLTEEEVYALADRILGEITKPGMSQRDQAKAIYNYVHGKIRYVGTSDKSNWRSGAYVGLTRGRGDCYNYFAASKLLLTRAGIPNVDLTRTGGNTDHYWQLVNVGSGYYHFDACPHPNGYPITSFLLTEAEVRDYSERCKSVRKNYYVYDYDACPVTVVGTPSASEPPTETQTPLPTETLAPAETQTPLPTETAAPAETQTPLPTETPAPAETQAPAVEPPAETPAPLPTETLTPTETPLPTGSVPPATESPAATKDQPLVGIPLQTESPLPTVTTPPGTEPPAPAGI